MIFLWILQFFINAVNVVFSWLPTVTVLPYGLDTGLQDSVGVWNAFLSVFWPLQIIWTYALLLLGLEVTLMILRFFFGARIPHV